MMESSKTCTSYGSVFLKILTPLMAIMVCCSIIFSETKTSCPMTTLKFLTNTCRRLDEKEIVMVGD